MNFLGVNYQFRIEFVGKAMKKKLMVLIKTVFSVKIIGIAKVENIHIYCCQIQKNWQNGSYADLLTKLLIWNSASFCQYYHVIELENWKTCLSYPNWQLKTYPRDGFSAKKCDKVHWNSSKVHRLPNNVRVYVSLFFHCSIDAFNIYSSLETHSSLTLIS